MRRLFLLFLTTMTLALSLSESLFAIGPCYGCRRFMDLREADTDAIPYGYQDNLNYPDRYALPLNRYFPYPRRRPFCLPYTKKQGKFWLLPRCF